MSCAQLKYFSIKYTRFSSCTNQILFIQRHLITMSLRIPYALTMKFYLLLNEFVSSVLWRMLINRSACLKRLLYWQSENVISIGSEIVYVYFSAYLYSGKSTSCRVVARDAILQTLTAYYIIYEGKRQAMASVNADVTSRNSY